MIGGRPPQSNAFKRFVFATAAVLAIAIIYAWFVDEAIAPEAIAALLTGTTVLATVAWIERAEPARVRPSLGFVRPFVTRVLPAVIRENLDLLGPVLWRTLVRRDDVRGRWIALRYAPAASDDASERGRRTFVIFASNLTPNALPLDIDPQAGSLILHQLVHRRESAADDSQYPV